jgi:CubicO group peptidase (beta-lactamase class C family)
MPSEKSDGYEVANELVSEIRESTQRKNICGLSMALVSDKGAIWYEGLGYTDRSKKEKVTADTLFSSQSVGKCLTATAFMIMASRGLVNLDDPIRKYYTEFTINTRFGDPEEEIRKITFRRMLSHWAGFTHVACVGNEYSDKQNTFEEHVKSISEGWLRSPVGSELSYSNLGYSLTGYVMGLILNKSYEEVMKEILFQPLGMTSATYKIEEALKQFFAKGHYGDYAAPVVQVPMLPAGGLYVSANDLGKFISFHLSKGNVGGQQLINPSLFADMYRSQYPHESDFGYGLGIYSCQKIRNAKVYQHSGGGYGYQTLMQWVPEYHVGVVVLENSDPSNNEGVSRRLLEWIIDEKTKPKAEPAKPDTLQRLEGSYTSNGNLAPQLIRISYENGRLICYSENSETELFPQSLNEFRSSNETKYVFELDKEGNPSAVYVDDSIFPFRAKYNDGPKDKPGPNDSKWKEYIGVYQYQENGRSVYFAVIANGYLYVSFGNNLKLHHHKKDTYFTADGEALVFRKDAANFKGIPAKKINLDADQVIQTIRLNNGNLDAYSITIESVANVLYVTRGISQALSFIERATAVDGRFKTAYDVLGRRLYATGKFVEAQKCFRRLLDIDAADKSVAEMLQKTRTKISLKVG